MSSRSALMAGMLIEHSCASTHGDYFVNRDVPYSVDFGSVTGRASTLRKAAEIFYQEMEERRLLGERAFFLGHYFYGMPLAAAIAQEAYMRGLDARFGFFARDEDLRYLDRDRRETEKRLKKAYPLINVTYAAPVRATELRGKDLSFTAAMEAARIARFLPGVDCIVGAGYEGLYLAAAIGIELHRMDERFDPFIAYEMFGRAANRNGQNPPFGGAVNPRGNALVVSARQPSFGFFGSLQDGDRAVMIYDVSGGIRQTHEDIKNALRQNKRAGINAILVGVDRKEKEKAIDGYTSLAANLDINTHIPLQSITTVPELLERWKRYPDPSRRLSGEKVELISKYRDEWGY